MLRAQRLFNVRKKGEACMHRTIVGIDSGKIVFPLHGVDARGRAAIVSHTLSESIEFWLQGLLEAYVNTRRAGKSERSTVRDIGAERRLRVKSWL